MSNSPTINSLELIRLGDNDFGKIGLELLTSQFTSLEPILNKAAIELTKAIKLAANSSIPTIKPGARPKPWWNDDLVGLRKVMLRNQRDLKLDQTTVSKQLYLKAKNTYFLAIKKAKRDHWNSFLEKEDPKSIFKAMSYTKDRQIEKIPAILGEQSFTSKYDKLRYTLFPTPLSAPSPN
jgi:hypothetical protein